MSDPAHWDAVYGRREEARLTWFEAEARLSLERVRAVSTPADAVIDVGGGASRLVDGLLAAGYRDLTVLDLSAAALEASRDRLGDAAGAVRWLAADLRDWAPDRRWAVWHDRAVFHFMTREGDRRAYLQALAAALAPGGHAIIATFSRAGPDSCSGLPVCRYDPADLTAEIDRLAPGLLRPVEAAHFVHETPKGNAQAFQVSTFRGASIPPAA